MPGDFEHSPSHIVVGFAHRIDYLLQWNAVRGEFVGVDVGVPIRVADVANVSLGAALQRGQADLNGEGITVGGRLVFRTSIRSFTRLITFSAFSP